MTTTHSPGRGEPSVQDTGTALDTEQLARALGQIARQLQGETEPDAMLRDLVAAGVRLIPGADEGSLSIVAGRRTVSAQHPTSDLPRLVDDLQTETGQGPCLSAVYEQHTVRVSDLRSESRWPEFTRRAAELGVGAMLSFQLYVDSDNLGALNLFSRTANAFTDESEAVGLIFASHAAIAFADAQQVHHLNVALANRDVIGQAKGILMERYDLTAEQAFRALIRVSQTNNRKLNDLALELATPPRMLPGLVADADGQTNPRSSRPRGV